MRCVAFARCRMQRVRLEKGDSLATRLEEAVIAEGVERRANRFAVRAEQFRKMLMRQAGR